ncbi:MAG: hypothetical protein ACRDKS_11580 [Actinomycetota bacterium]
MARRIALILAASVAAAGVALALRVADRGPLETSPPTRENPVLIGSPVLIGTGHAGNLTWEVRVQRSDAGPCIEVRDSDGGRTLGCGFGVPERRVIGFLIHRTRDGRQLLAAGPVVREAVMVRLSLTGGEWVETMPVGPSVDDGVRTFVADLSAKPNILAAEAFDRDGAVLGRRGLDLDGSGRPATTDH